MTTREPGPSEVFTEGFTVSPFALAFCASNPAASMTLGLEVFVQDVMAAMRTEPWVIVSLMPSLESTVTSQSG